MDWLGDAWSGVVNFFTGGNRESEEERRRKQEEARRRAEQQAQQKQQASQTTRVGNINMPSATVIQPTRQAPQQQPQAQPTFKPTPAPKPQPAPRQTNDRSNNVRNNVLDNSAFNFNSNFGRVEPRIKNPTSAQKEVDAIYKSKVQDFIKKEEERLSPFWWLTDPKWRERAEALARTAAVSEWQNRNNTTGGADIREVVDMNTGLARGLQEESKELREKTNRGADTLRLLPMAGMGELGANLLRGNFGGGEEVERRLLREQFDLTDAEFDALPKEERDKFLLMARGGLAAGTLDVVGFGAGSLARGTISASAKKAVKEAAKQALEVSRKGAAKSLAVSTTVGGAAGGGIGFLGSKYMGADDEATLQNTISGFLTGMFAGAAGSPLDAAANQYASIHRTTVQQAKNRIKEAAKDAANSSELDDAAKAALRDIESEVKVNSELSDELKQLADDGRIESNITNKRTDELEIGSDSTPRNELDPARVQEYVQAIQRGDTIDPIIVRTVDGKDYVQDGAHRLEALRQLGIEDAPTVNQVELREGSLEAVSRLMSQADDIQDAIPSQQMQQAEQARGGSRSINAEEVMQNIRERNRIYNEADPATRAEINERAAAQRNADDVTLDSPYSREAVWRDLVGAIGEEDARRLTSMYNMSANDWRTILNATGDLSGAVSRPAVISRQIQTVLNRQPSRSTGQPAAPEVVDTPEGRVDTSTGEIIEDTPTGMVNPFDEVLRQRAEYMENILRNADDVLKDSGSSYATLFNKIQQADRTNIDPELTDIEARAYTVIREALDSVLDDMVERGAVRPDVGRRQWYLPQQREGSVDIPRTAEEFYDTRFGYDQSRTDAIDLGELDDSFDPVIDYYVKGTPEATKQAIFNDVVETNPNITQEAATAITESKYKRINETNQIAKDPKADPRKIDSLTELGKEAELEGIQRFEDNSNYNFADVNAREKLRAIESDERGKSLYDSGFDQYRFAHAYAQDVTNGLELIDVAVSRGLNKVSQDKMQRIAQRADYWVDRAKARLDVGDIDQRAFEQARQESYAQALRLIAKSNVEESIKRVEYTVPRVRDFINYEFNSMNIGYNKAQSFANNFGKITRRIWNNSMRNLNVNSFLNEMTDVINVVNRFGVSRENLANLNPLDMYSVVNRYGVGHSLNRMDSPDVAVEAMGVLGSNNRAAIDKLFKAADTVDRKTALYSVAENYKAATYLKAAEDYWSARGLTGTELRQQVLTDFDKDMIPLDHFSRVFSTDNQAVKLMAQYLDWNILHTMQQGRRLAGTDASAAGRQIDMSRGGRIADNIATNLAPRIGIGMMRGAPIVITLGILDPLGVASQDYSGIQDKTALDEVMSGLGVSPVLGLASQFYLNYRQDEIAEENYDGNPPEDSRGDWVERSIKNVGKMFTPFGGQIDRTGGMLDVLNKGYSENKSGRVQYLAPENPLDIARGIVMGRGQTQPAREYSGTPDIFSFISGDASFGELLTSNPSFEALQTFLGQDNVGDYQRPVTDRDVTVGVDDAGNAMTRNFNDMIKNTNSRAEQEKILEQAREYNAILDTFRRENPQAAEAYDQIMGNNDLVNPEYWKEIIGTNADGSINLDIFKLIGERKKELAKSLGAPYDPMYDLPDDRARSLLQLKSTATGDDLALRNILYKSDWYIDYVNDREEFYNKMPEMSDTDSLNQTERVKQWNQYEKQLHSLSMLESPYLAREFPYNAAYRAAEREYEKKTGESFFGSDEANDWWSRYGRGKQAEDVELDKAKLEVINQMRVIEGFPPMSIEEYTQATEVASTGGGGGFSGGGGGDWQFLPDFYNTFQASNAPKVRNASIEFRPNTSVGRRTNQQRNLGARSAGSNTGGYSL